MALQVVLPAARPQAMRLGLAAGVVVVQAGVVLLRPWPLALAVDHVLDQGASPLSLPLAGTAGPVVTLVLAAAAGIALSGLLALLDLVLERSSQGAAERVGAALRHSMFETSMSRSLRWHDRMRSGELVSRMTTDVGRLLDAVVAVTTTLVPSVVTVAAVLLLMMHIDPSLAVVALSVVPVLAVLTVRRRRRTRQAQEAARRTSGSLVAATNDLLRNVRAVQAFGRGDRALDVYGTHNRSLLDAELRAVDVEARWAPVDDLVLSVGTGLVLAVGGAHVLGGSLSLGALLVVLAYLRDLYSPVRGLTRLSATLAKASVSAERVQEVLRSQETVRDLPAARIAPPLSRSVRFDQVAFGYERPHRTLAALDLRVEAGETVCVVGPSGTGKSTLTYLLLRLYDVDGGRILIDDVDIRDCTLASVRQRFSYLPQDPWLLDATLAENIAFGSSTATRHEVLAASRLALVDEFAERLPHGYDTRLGESAVRLSGGQRRRVALARAAVRRAPMLLLDEPTASLDTESAELVVRAIRRLSRDRTSLIVTHDPRLVAIADRVVDLGSTPPAPRNLRDAPTIDLWKEVSPA